MDADCIKLLKNLDIFEGLDDPEFELICSVARKKVAKKNTLLFSKGDENKTMYIIRKGTVDVSIYTESGKELILSTLHEGQYFGELSLLDGLPISANITLTTDCEFIFFNKEDFFRVLQSNSEIAVNIIRHLCGKIRKLTDKAEDFALNDVYERFVHLITELSTETEDGFRVVNTPLTHKSIALRIGSSREMVSRVMKELELGGYVETKNKIITVKKKLPAAW
jgi:CRP/FNR family transcriptional regulator, cyclic AMP receptor protein